MTLNIDRVDIDISLAPQKIKLCDAEKKKSKITQPTVIN